jgi:hypothetical protein
MLQCNVLCKLTSFFAFIFLSRPFFYVLLLKVIPKTVLFYADSIEICIFRGDSGVWQTKNDVRRNIKLWEYFLSIFNESKFLIFDETFKFRAAINKTIIFYFCILSGNKK